MTAATSRSGARHVTPALAVFLVAYSALFAVVLAPKGYFTGSARPTVAAPQQTP